MNILIVGLGEVGSFLAKMLSTEGHAVSVVDPDRQRLRRVTEALDVQAVLGDGSRPDVLDRADANSADLLLAVSNDDNANMLACLFGKRIGAKRSVLRVKDMRPFQGFRTFFRKNLMFDQVLSVEDLAATEVIKAVRQNQAVAVESFADGRIQMRRLRLGAESTLLDVAVRDLAIPDGMLIAAIERGGEIVIPGGDDVCAVEDELLVLGEPRAIATFERKTGIRPTHLRSVVVFGASSIVAEVCRVLVRLGVHTRVIVPDRSDGENLAGLVDGIAVLHGEGTDYALLSEERVGEADAFLGLSDQDEHNLMSCQIARSLGVARTVALVQKPDYVTLYQRLGIDVAVSPRLLCANQILSYVRRGSVGTIATLHEGKAEVLEIEVQPGSRLIGRTLREARFPRGSVIGAIARESGDIVIPRGDDEIEALDNLVIFVLRDVVDQVIAVVGSRA